MEHGTPIKKLRGLEFYVYLYALETPRHYVGLRDANTIGVGYYGKDEHVAAGLMQVRAQTDWLRENMERLSSELGTHFADKAQYLVYDRFECDLSLHVENYIMSNIECQVYIRDRIMGNRIPKIR